VTCRDDFETRKNGDKHSNARPRQHTPHWWLIISPLTVVVAVVDSWKSSACAITLKRLSDSAHFLHTVQSTVPGGNYGWSRLKRRVSADRVARARGPYSAAAVGHQTIHEHTLCIFNFYRESTSCPPFIHTSLLLMTQLSNRLYEQLVSTIQQLRIFDLSPGLWITTVSPATVCCSIGFSFF